MGQSGDKTKKYNCGFIPVQIKWKAWARAKTSDGNRGNKTKPRLFHTVAKRSLFFLFFCALLVISFHLSFKKCRDKTSSTTHFGLGCTILSYIQLDELERTSGFVMHFWFRLILMEIVVNGTIFKNKTALLEKPILYLGTTEMAGALIMTRARLLCSLLL